MEFKKVNWDDFKIKDSIALADCLNLYKFITKNRIRFTEAIKRIAFDRNVSPPSVSANCTSNQFLQVNDWNQLYNNSDNKLVIKKIYDALIRRHPKETSKIKKIIKLDL